MRRKLVLTVVASLWIGCGGDDGGGGGNDAGPGGDGGGDVDADPGVDAAPLPACAEDLNPLADNSTAGEQDSNVVISEVDPGTFIEVYNSGTSPVMLSTTGYSWCNNRSYPRFTNHNILVMPGGRRRINWPGGSNTDAGGDVSIWSMPTFSSGSGADILDYVCWGNAAAGGTRLNEALGVGKWTGACVAAIPPGGSVVRLPNTMGTSAADYQTQATPMPEDCE